jgi:hypothetical protein
MTYSLPFGTQLIGQVEKALGAILERLLAGSGVTEPEWVALSVLSAGDDSADEESAVQRTAAALKVDRETARSCLDRLEAHGLLGPAEGAQGTFAVTSSGRAFHASLRVRIGEIVTRLWGDLPADELVVSATVLNTVLSRADTELARLAA